MMSPTLGLLLWASVRAGEPAETTAGWVKHPKSPVLGGDLGTCFDISVLKEGDTYRMWFSWRPEKSIALVESKDGVKWSKPVPVLGPNNKTDWENDLNRPAVIRSGGWGAAKSMRPASLRASRATLRDSGTMYRS